MDLAIQFAAACGPIALAIMGVVVSLSPPTKTRWAHRLWAASFLVVGVITAGTIFYELHGTDQILGQIWEHVREGKPPAKEGARFVLNAGPINRSARSVDISAINKGDVVARASSAGGYLLIYSDHLMNVGEEDEWYKQAKAYLPPLGTGVDFLKEGGRTMTFEVKATDAQFDSAVAGKAYIYIFFVMSFKDETTPPEKRFLASLCVRYQGGALDSSKICFGHNETRQLD